MGARAAGIAGVTLAVLLASGPTGVAVSPGVRLAGVKSPLASPVAADRPAPSLAWVLSDPPGGGGPGAAPGGGGSSPGASVSGAPRRSPSDSGNSGAHAPPVEKRPVDRPATGGGDAAKPAEVKPAAPKAAPSDGAQAAKPATTPPAQSANTQQKSAQSTATTSGTQPATAQPSTQAGANMSPVQQKTNPNNWSWLPPSARDLEFGAAGAGLGGLESVYKGAFEPEARQAVMDKIDGFASKQRTYGVLANMTSDPSMKARYGKEVAAADKGVAYQQKTLAAIAAPRTAVANAHDPQFAAQQVTKAGAKLGAAGVSTAVKAGQVGDALSDLGPTGAKVGQTVAAAGVAAGNKAIDLGQGLAGQASAMAPRLAQVGGIAADTLKAAGRIATPLGVGLTALQGYQEYRDGKSVSRVVAESGGSLAGGYAGGLAGAALGTAFIPIPGVGTAVGAAVGNFVGSYVGGKIGDFIADRTIGEGH